MGTTPAGLLHRFGSTLAAVLVAVGLPTSAWSQQATPTTLLGVFVTEQNVVLPVPRVTVCASPDASEPAFWGKWTAATGPLPTFPGAVVMQDIPLPPGMSAETIVVTVAKQGYQDTVTTDALSSFLPIPGTGGAFSLRRIGLPRGGQSNGDCGTPPRDPLGPAVGMMIDPPNETALPGDVVSFTLHWSSYPFAARWYLYDWVIDDLSIVRPVAPSQTTELKVEAVAPGMTRITAYLLRPDGMTKQSESAWIKVETRGPPPPPPPPPEQYTFGWETPVTQREMNDFALPHPCVVGETLMSIVHARPTTNPPGCSIRASASETCSSCHRMGGEQPTLQGIQKAAFCNLVPTFVANPAAAANPRGAKPQNLKNFFQDWYDRRDRATGECPD
jgi:hypothetical protein